MAPRDTESSDWQVNYPEIKMRLAHMLRSCEWTDCTFRFEIGPGSAAQSLEAHKLILAMASPVFAAMFYGNFDDKEKPVLISDIEETTFSSMLNYIYTDEVDITSAEAACDLFRAANKYILVHLEKKCINYLYDKLSPQNVCCVYELACLSNEDELIQKCLQIFSKETRDVLKSGSFENAQLETVRTIYSLDSLNINSELELLKALVEYTEELELDNCKMYETENCKDTSTGNSDVTTQLRKKNVISSVLEHVRFLTLAPGEFAECKNLHRLLSEAEILAISMNLASTQSVIPMPAGFSTSRLPRNQASRNQLDRGCSRATVSIELKNILSRIRTSENIYSTVSLGTSEIFYAKNVPWKCEIRVDTKMAVLYIYIVCCLDNILQRKVPWSCRAIIDVECFLNNNDAIYVETERYETHSFSSKYETYYNYMALPWCIKASHDVVPSIPVISDESIITVNVSVTPTVPTLAVIGYIYTDEVDITSAEAACDLFRATNKYILVHLEKKCINYLFDKVSPRNVCYVYELACLFNENELIKKCLQNFKDTSTGNSDVTTRLRKRNVISSLLEYVRFLTLSPVEFAECKNLLRLLSEAEILAISMNLASTNTVIPMPAGLSTSRLPRNQLDRGCSRATVSIELKNILSQIRTSEDWVSFGTSEIFYAKNVPWRYLIQVRTLYEVHENDYDFESIIYIICCLDKKLQRKVPWSCDAIIDVEYILNNNGAIYVEKKRNVSLSFSSENGGDRYMMKLPWCIKSSCGSGNPFIHDNSIITVNVSVTHKCFNTGSQ